MFDVEIYPPLHDKINLPIAQMRDVVVDTAGQGRLVLSNGSIKQHVSTCNQYQTALKKNYLPNSDYDLSTLSFFTLWCGSLNWLEKAKAAQKSYIKNFNLSQSYGRLPSKIFFSALGSKKNGLTLIEKYPDVTLVDIKDKTITVESKKSKIKAVISLLAKADFNNNNQQDLLLSVAEYSLTNSYRQYGIFVVTRHSLNGAFDIVV